MGNWLNKEWSQIESFSGDETKPANTSVKPKAKVLKKKKSFNTSRSLDSTSEDEQKNDLDNTNNSTPLNTNNKFVIADFDPRSPTNGIVR